MAITYAKLFEPAVLTTTAATIFTVPSPASTLLRGGRVRATNTTASPASVTLYAVPFSGVGGDSNSIATGKMVNANDYIDIDLPIMKNGDFLQALSGTDSAITLQPISGAYFA